MTTTRGKSIFQNRVEYPLPARSGVRDYVFYFVPDKDYGEAARKFFAKFFPHHVSQALGSFEELFAFLALQIEQHRVERIREIVTVCHANHVQLAVPVVARIDEKNQWYKSLNMVSLAYLQKDFADGEYRSFKSDRQVVVAHLTDESWVTVRACRFGKTAEGLYALFSLFGGKANVYAPVDYQFFGWHPIPGADELTISDEYQRFVDRTTGDPGRLENQLAVHEHLVKQRFLPRDLHTPDRKDIVVKYLIDKARFSEPVVLASAPTADPASEAMVRYARLVAALNRLHRHRPSGVVEEAFAAAGLPLTAAARVNVLEKNSRWIVADRVSHAGKPYRIEYTISEQIEPGSRGGDVATLSVLSRLLDAYTAREGLTIQRFFGTEDNDLFKGKLGTLASSVDGASADDGNRRRLEAVTAVLHHPGELAKAPGAEAFLAIFREQTAIDLGPATLSKRTASEWVIDDGRRYAIKRERALTANGERATTIGVYSDFDDDAMRRYECELLAYIGDDPDTPGPELAAYLDRYSIEDLVSVIDHLRAPYRAEHAFYIHHAQQAIKRKAEYDAFWAEQIAGRKTNDPLFESPYLTLRPIEQEDRRALVYESDFSRCWNQVKASNPPEHVVDKDLFSEEMLFDKFDIREEALLKENRIVADDEEADSPSTNEQALRAVESRELTHFFVSQKDTIRPPVPVDDVTCPEFAQIISKWKGLQGHDVEFIRDSLEGATTESGKTFLEALAHYYDDLSIGILKDLAGMTVFEEGLEEYIVSKIPRISGYSKAVGLISEIVEPLMIGWDLWEKFLEDQERTAQTWEEIGRVTAMRQWLRALIDLTRRRENDFPDKIEIDLSTVAGESVYYVARYFAEQRATDGVASEFVYATNRMKKGFDEGVKQMDAAGDEMIATADKFIVDLLHDSGIFDPCKINVLRNAGLLEMSRCRARALRYMADKMLDELPHV